MRLYKLGAIVLLIYTFLAGFFIPLKPGVTFISSNKIERSGKFEIEIFAANSHFAQKDVFNKVFLKRGKDYYLCANVISVVNNNQIKVQFNIDRSFFELDSVTTADLIVNNKHDGSFVLRRNIIINPAKILADTADFASQKCKPSVENEEANFISYPNREILYESIRNLFFHVPMWFAMILVLTASMYMAVKYLSTGILGYDQKSKSLAEIGVLLGVLGILTGMIWAQYAWGKFWSGDPKQNGAAVALLIYMAYMVLRSSLGEEQQRAKISSVYNIFAFATLIPLLFILPRLTDSLHPGNGGNPAFSSYDLDNTMRLVFYPAVLGWTLLGFWLAELKQRIDKLIHLQLLNEN